jgi:hypothetical protein
MSTNSANGRGRHKMSCAGRLLVITHSELVDGERTRRRLTLNVPRLSLRPAHTNPVKGPAERNLIPTKADTDSREDERGCRGRRTRAPVSL